MAGNRWVDNDWSRDWLFWIGAGGATALTVLSITMSDAPAWRLVTGWLVTFAVIVATLGFVRTAWRAYSSE